MMRKKMTRLYRFTLIELMVVMAVIISLTAVGIMVGPLIARKSSESKTRALLQAISVALEQSKNSDLTGGNYPVLGDPQENTYAPFYIDMSPNVNKIDPEWLRETKLLQFFDYESVKANVVRTGGEGSEAKGYIVDGFGTPFLYMVPGYRMNGSYDLVSMGANSVPGSGWKDSELSEIRSDGNFKKHKLSLDNSKMKKYIRALGEGDDIANFGR